MKKFGLASPERERVGRLILTRLSKLGMDERDVPQNFVRLPRGRLWAPTMRNVKICEKGATLFESYPLRNAHGETTVAANKIARGKKYLGLLWPKFLQCGDPLYTAGVTLGSTSVSAGPPRSPVILPGF